MDCPEVNQRLELYVLDGLPVAERVAVRFHLASCPVCQEAEARYRRLVGRVKGAVPESNPSPQLVQSTMRAVQTEIRHVRRSLYARKALLTVGAMAASLAILAGTWHWIVPAAKEPLPPTMARVELPTPPATPQLRQTAGALSMAASLADGVVLRGERMYLLLNEGTGGRVAARDVPSGRSLWQVQVPNSCYLAADDHRVFCLTAQDDRNLELLALDGSSGQVSWRYPLVDKERVTSPVRPVVLDGQRICWTGNNKVHLISSSDGRTIWSQSIPDEGLLSGAAVVGQTLYVASSAALYCYNLKDGNQLWRKPLPTKAAGPTRPLLAAAQKEIFVAIKGRSGNDHLLCLNRAGGEMVWEKNVPTVNYLLAAADGLYLRGQNLHALDSTTGQERWTCRASGHGPLTHSDGLLYFVDFGKSGRLVAVDALGGNKAWELGGLAAGDAFKKVGDTGYIKTQDGLVHAIALAAPRQHPAQP